MQPAQPAGRIYYGWVLVTVAFVAVAVSFGPIIVFTFGVFLKPLSEEFGWSRGQLSLAFSLAAMTVSLCSPFIGRATDRLGARPVVIICSCIYAAAFASLSFLTGSLWQLYGTYILIGVVGNGATQLPYSRVITEWFDRRRGLALSLMMTGVGAGIVVMPPFAQWLIDQQGWREAYCLLGATMFLLAVPLPALLLRRGAHKDQDSAADTSGGLSDDAGGLTAREAVRQRAFWQMLLCFFLLSISTNGCIAHFAPLLTDRGLPAQQAAIATSVMGVATMVGRLITGWLLDRYFGPWVGAAFFLIAALGIGILPISGSAVTAWASALLMGLSMGAEADVMPYLIGRYFGLRSFTELFGYAFSAYAVAGALGPALMGLSFDQTGNYSVVLVALAAAAFVGGALMWSLPRYPVTALRPKNNTP